MASPDIWASELSNRASNIAVIAATGMQTMNSFNMRNIASQLTTAVSGQTAQIVSAFSSSLIGEPYRNRRSRMTTIHREVGFSAQEAAIRAYLARKDDGASGYRSKAPKPWDRDSGGKMLAALQDPSIMFRAGFDGLEYVNMTLMDKKARQWYRLNFGARGRSGAKYKALGDGGSYVMNFFGASPNSGGSIGPFSFSGYEPSKPFTIPRGLFIDEQGKPQELGSATGQEFVPLRYKNIQLKSDFQNKGPSGKRLVINRKTLASGIKGTRFLDAGLQAITKNLPVGYTVLMNEWFTQAAAGVVSPISAIGVSPRDAAILQKQIEAQILAYSNSSVTSRFLKSVT